MRFVLPTQARLEVRQSQKLASPLPEYSGVMEPESYPSEHAEKHPGRVKKHVSRGDAGLDPLPCLGAVGLSHIHES